MTKKENGKTKEKDGKTKKSMDKTSRSLVFIGRHSGAGRNPGRL